MSNGVDAAENPVRKSFRRKFREMKKALDSRQKQSSLKTFLVPSRLQRAKLNCENDCAHFRGEKGKHFRYSPTEFESKRPLFAEFQLHSRRQCEIVAPKREKCQKCSELSRQWRGDKLVIPLRFAFAEYFMKLNCLRKLSTGLFTALPRAIPTKESRSSR